MSSLLELLAPAKNADFGIEAITHGADAVYIGGPAFGARANAGNGIADIERLAAHARRFHAKVFVTLNTILRDDELEEARRLAWQFYEAGADALIVQDMGLLELDLPPIQLHASTQTDIRTPEKARFLQDVGFSQIVLARELTLQEIAKIDEGLRVGADGTPATLEFFVHGALCVAYSGQCYISHAHTGRSANRGECSQACRLPYTLEDEAGRIVAHDKHLLSMKDNDQSANLRALIEAGIRSFKIEGRLKDLSYVKNITAHYRTLLDEFLNASPGYRRASSGRCSYTFTPRPEKTFNRGATDYFVNERKPDIGAFDTPKFSGELIGEVSRIGPDWFEAETSAPLHNGDGLSYYDSHRELVGLRVNRADGARLFPNEMPDDLAVGTELYRNRDQEFERALEKKSAERRIGLHLQLSETPDGFALTLTDEDGITASAALPHAHEVSKNADRALAGLRENLGKLGSTIFAAKEISLDLSQPWFLPASAVNGLRRDAIAALEAARAAACERLPRRIAVGCPQSGIPATQGGAAPTYPENELSYLANVLNSAARAFYAKHGVSVIAEAYETDSEKGEVSLMITRHCLRYSYNLCPKEVKGLRPDPMTLVNGKEKLTLRFDCKKCEMHVIGKLKKGRQISITPVAH
ncbi:peptidase U32 family protein [Sulfuritalea hydrogenivorans]|uniref:Collagenase-like protease n=1 Tax=Sulfuritalea hydrogenivorans sk43H TaxID=1223802 RepID=W0SDY6_9PROT|nr:U32 family peptidase [Sulfuritalea hydrogenivorans]BAO28985.1 collagenase-like protease [Sulfuritalea hydrogenivorans sk43H]